MRCTRGDAAINGAAAGGDVMFLVAKITIVW